MLTFGQQEWEHHVNGSGGVLGRRGVGVCQAQGYALERAHGGGGC